MASFRTLIAMLVASFLGATALSACNTMEGLGQDIEAGGENLQQSATETKRKM
jgi:entericidin B